jgi:hypothetical protein
VIVLETTNHRIQEMTDIHEMIEVHVLPLDENLVEIELEQVNHEMISF